MLESLIIKNYAIIDELSITYKNGLNIITGETGAGKSIILGALGLILGNRADHSSLFDANKKCMIRGVFTDLSKELISTLTSQDIDIEDDELILQREITSNGKSRAYINDTPVKLKALKNIGRQMVDLHMQFDQLDILDKKRQFEIIDAFSGHRNDVVEYTKLYQSWSEKKLQFEKLVDKKNAALREYDYIKFQAEELSNADINPNEEEEIENQLSLQTHAERISEHLSNIYQQISESDSSLLNTFRAAIKSLDSINGLPEHISNINTRLNSLVDELSDLSRDAENASNDIEYSPSNIEELTNRINLINSLTNKHHVSNSSELKDLLTQWNKQLSAFASVDEDLTNLETEINTLKLELHKKAKVISSVRKKNLSSMEKAIMVILHDLEMKKAKFKIELKPSKELNNLGIDTIDYLFTANSGSDLKSIKNAASGGELSRLNLSLKSIVADKIDLQTMILDEIDTGISGHVARKMGLLLKRLAKKHQIVSITHSPQIAASGTHHLYVYKELSDNKTQTRIKELNSKERIHNIAIMLSENPPSKSAIKNAEELMELK